MHVQPATILIEEFEYPAIQLSQPQFWQDLPEIGAKASRREPESEREKLQSPAAVDAAVEAVQEPANERAAQSFEAGRKQGIVEGRQSAQEEQGAALRQMETQRIQQAAHLVEQFVQERDRFLQSAENEVVRLALAIAARILRREAQTDPLFLTGAVRVALGQLAETTQVRLRVPATEAELWRETVEHIPNLKLKPSIVPDEHLLTGDCVVETELGSADLGVRSQLGEIERGFFDGTVPDSSLSRTDAGVSL
jgi:flagellar assembly protein FliH